MDSLRKWTGRNPKNTLNNDQKLKLEGVFQTKEQKPTPHPCVCCDKQGHKASQYESVKSVENRRLILPKKTSVLTVLEQNIEPLIVVATNFALFATQNTILPYVTKMRMSY